MQNNYKNAKNNAKVVYMSLMQKARKTVDITNSDRKWSEIKLNIPTEKFIPYFSGRDR